MEGGFDINKLCKEAQTRWLKPIEVLFILRNHERFQLTHKPPDKPPSGSFFLFNRRVLRNFRNDGYLWRKKNNRRTIAEAHERLKVGNAEVLACYYARGEQNPCFQRRSYWMLDPAYDYIVFVHYREVAEGRYAPQPIFSWSTESPSTFNQSSSITDAQVRRFPSEINEINEKCKNSCSLVSVEEVSSEFVAGKNERPHLNKMDISETWNQPLQPVVNEALRKLEEQLSLDSDDGGGGGGGYINSKEKLLPDCNQNEKSEDLGFLNYETSDFSQEILDSLFDQLDDEGNIYVEEAGLQVGSSTLQMPKSPGEILDSLFDQLDDEGNIYVEEAGLQVGSSTLQMLKSPGSSGWSHGFYCLLNSTPEQNSCRADFGLLTVEKDNNIHELDTVVLAENSVYSSSAFSGISSDQSERQTPIGTDCGLPVAQKPWFSIREISPEWAFSFEKTKVIIAGDFLCNPSGHLWTILFGDTEVPLEIVQEGVFRCLAPEHDTGKVKLCITSGNGEPRSDVREFEFRANTDTSSFSSTLQQQTNAIKSTEELLLLVNFVRILLYGHDSASIPEEGDVESYTDPSRKLKKNQDQLGGIVEALLAGRETSTSTMDSTVQELLKDKLLQWLSSKRLGNADQTCALSNQERCIIHMISGLGYEWALNPILNSGIGINFRDTNGWTALHWAASFGREKMVAALLAAGASAGSLTDPTPQDPAGKTPGSLAAANGHKGLAGYLSEAALTNHFFSLVTAKSEISKGSGSVEADGGVESMSQRSAYLQGGTEDQFPLRDSLAAVRNATQAAARIQATFRAYSFRKKHQNADQNQCCLSLEDMHGFSLASRGFHDPKFHKAALSIQKNYRCWKKRNEFVTLRKHVIKLQACVRAHQAKKKYEFLLTVGILEKIVLRWNRRGVGLPRFQAEPDEEEEKDILKVFRKQKVDATLDEAVSRVISMVHSPTAQQQYRRMLESYRQAELELIEVEQQHLESLTDDWESVEIEDHLHE